MANHRFALLDAFRQTFSGRVYRHRDSTLGNRIARQLFEDLLTHRVAHRYIDHVESKIGVVNRGGGIHGKVIRRNDSVFGRPPAGVAVGPPPQGFQVPEAPIAEPRIGCEVKILAKAQQKQIDRVINDLAGFGRKMKSLSEKCVRIAIVGVNHEPEYVGYEGQRPFRGRLRSREAEIVTVKLGGATEEYDEFLILPFRATNVDPFPFDWLSSERVNLDYGAALTRVGERYDERFR